MSPTDSSGKADRVYRLIRSEIELGTFSSGQSLPEALLAEHTGASRTPVREAIRRLAADGLIDLEPRKAPSVARVSLRSARALFDFRRMLEPTAIGLVARLARDNDSVRQTFAELRDRCDQFLTRDHRADQIAEEFGTLTTEFDIELAKCTPNQYLARAIAELRPQTSRLRAIAHEDRSRFTESVQEHAEMCSAVVSADADRAAAACVMH
ncbi:MAG TPA: GntR family transcriptional regulator, partial [Galbitalea sp.]|nr:GntR family transcriptional regulator [Galbitalea sp.]